jgi:hypothetical protein
MATPLLAPWLLAGLDTGLLRRLLAPHRAFLEAHHLTLGDDTPAWRARLAGALNGDDPALPAALQFALSAVGDLASPEGEGRLRALATERGVTVPIASGRAADLAVWAYLDERALFREAHAHLCLARRGSSGPLPSQPSSGGLTDGVLVREAAEASACSILRTRVGGGEPMARRRLFWRQRGERKHHRFVEAHALSPPNRSTPRGRLRAPTPG